MITVILQASNCKESMQNRGFQILDEVPIISYIIRRIKKEKDINIVMAVSDNAEDDIYVEVAKSEGVKLFRGSFDDVLSRLLHAAHECDVKDFVRIYSNYPLIDIEQLKLLYAEHISGNYDYSYNEHSRGVLWGTGCEVFTTSLLENMQKENLTIGQRSTIGYYIRQNSSNYKILKKETCKERPSYKVYLENNKDLEVIRELVNNLGADITNNSILKYFDNHTVLARYNMMEPAKEVGLEKLFLHPEKVKSLLNQNDMDTSYPISVEMTLTNTCNLKCVYCSDNDLRLRQGHSKEMDLLVVEKLFEDLSKGGTKGVVLEGGGEPTLYRHFNEVVTLAKKNNLSLGLITNGTVALQEEQLRQFEWIRVSLDASTSKEYLELKGVDAFERVVNNIANYTRYCNTVGVGYVVTKKNIAELETLVMRLKEAGVSYIQLRPVVDCEELYPYGVDLNYLKCYQTQSFGVIVDGMKENANHGNAGLRCRAHSLTSIISGDGSVYLCGRLNIYNWLNPVGNINSQSFQELWNGAERKKQAKMVCDSEFCKNNCPQCRITKFNELLERLDNTKSKHFI